MKALTIEEAAEFLRISKDSLRDMADAGKVPGAKMGPGNGRQWVFIDEILAEYLRDEIARQTQERRLRSGLKAAPPSASRPFAKRRGMTPPPLA